MTDDEPTVRAAIGQTLEQLPTYQRPRFIDVVEQLELSNAGKSKR